MGLLMTTSQSGITSDQFSVATVSKLSLLQEAVSTKSALSGGTVCPVNIHNHIKEIPVFKTHCVCLCVCMCAQLRPSLKQHIATAEFQKEIHSSSHQLGYSCRCGGPSENFNPPLLCPPATVQCTVCKVGSLRFLVKDMAVFAVH